MSEISRTNQIRLPKKHKPKLLQNKKKSQDAYYHFQMQTNSISFQCMQNRSQWMLGFGFICQQMILVFV